MSRFRLVSIIPQKDQYVDPEREIKSKLTTFVDRNLLTHNENELKLLKLLYSVVEPIMHENGLKLVFKGGNVMRLINNNFKDYLPPDSDKIIMDIFEPFLKQSDNDFTIFVDPNISNYNVHLNQLSFEIYERLDRVKDYLMTDLPHFFNLFKLSQQEIMKRFDELEKELNVHEVSFKGTHNKYIRLENIRDKKSKVLVFDDNLSRNTFIYNNLNTSIQFIDDGGNLIKFYLLRMKINFLLNMKDDIAGELIDISIPHRDDSEMTKLNTTEKFNKFMQENVESYYNLEYDFNYHIINIKYIIHDLYRILFLSHKYPWEESKFAKRIARLLYFIFIDFINDRPISFDNFMSIRVIFGRFIFAILTLKQTKTGIKTLDDIIISTLKIKEDSSNFMMYIDLLKQYSDAINRICYNMLKYIVGTEYIDEKLLYSLDVV